MIEEKVSVAPMLEWTDPHFRMLMRGITRKSVLYTEMLVDETIIHTHPSALDFMVGRAINEDPSVIQLGGHDPHTLAEAAAKCEAYCQGRSASHPRSSLRSIILPIFYLVIFLAFHTST